MHLPSINPFKKKKKNVTLTKALLSLDHSRVQKDVFNTAKQAGVDVQTTSRLRQRRRGGQRLLRQS